MEIANEASRKNKRYTESLLSGASNREQENLAAANAAASSRFNGENRERNHRETINAILRACRPEPEITNAESAVEIQR